jgi:hypothetical protein
VITLVAKTRFKYKSLIQ